MEDIEGFIRRAVWGDLSWRPAWDAAFEDLLKHNFGYRLAFDRLVKLGCDANWLRLQLASYAKPASATIVQLRQKLKAGEKQLLKLADTLENAARQARCLADSDYAQSLVHATLLTVRGPFDEHLAGIAYILRNQADVFRFLGDGRASEYTYTAEFLMNIVDHVKKRTGKRRLGLIAPLVNAAVEAHGWRSAVDGDALRKRLKELSSISARHGVGVSLSGVPLLLSTPKKRRKARL